MALCNLVHPLTVGFGLRVADNAPARAHLLCLEGKRTLCASVNHFNEPLQATFLVHAFDRL